jgi:hypothetical protein
MSQKQLTNEEIIKLITDGLKKIQEGVLALDPNTEPGPVDPKPETGYVKPGGWGANTDPKTWTVVPMKDKDKKHLFKVVDNKDKNVATHFTTTVNAQKFIDAVIASLPPTEPTDPTDPTDPTEPTDPTDPNPNPQPAAGQDKYGVKLLLSNGAVIDYNHSKNFRDDGKRFDFAVGKGMVDCELTGYFADHDGIDDEVSGKQRGGKHSDGSTPKTYDMGVKTTNGVARYRTEEKHPEYKDATTQNTISGNLGVGLKDKFIGYKFICRNVNENKAVNLQIWQDTGDNEGDKPANAWKQIANWVVTTPLWVTVADDHQETIRIDDDNGCPNLAYKWLSCAKI